MKHYAGVDVSLESASVCVVDAIGRIVPRPLREEMTLPGDFSGSVPRPSQVPSSASPELWLIFSRLCTHAFGTCRCPA
jgi:hypothetical protein